MNKYIWPLYLAVACLLAISCNKEETVGVSNEDINWLKIDDNPADPVIHAIYNVYKKTGVPVFYNDTIGHATRKDVWGHDYTYYEILHLNYALGNAQNTNSPAISSYTLCERGNVLPALNFLDTAILSQLPASVHIPSILLLEDMKSAAFGSYAFKGFNTIAVAQASSIPQMDADTRRKYKGAVFRAILTTPVMGDKYKTALARFFAVSKAFSRTLDIYANGGIPTYQFSKYITGFPRGYNITFQDLGFLGPDPVNQIYTPQSTWMDVSMYLEAMMGYSTEEFTNTYQAYPQIMTKYGILKNIVTDLGVAVR